MLPGRPYSIVAALETGRTSWTAVLDAARPGPDADQGVGEEVGSPSRQVIRFVSSSTLRCREIFPSVTASCFFRS
jgi:hypothetical protein